MNSANGKSAKKRYCLFKECSKLNANVSSFKFPKNPERCRKWAVACGCTDRLKDDGLLPLHFRVCGLHFQDTMFLNNLKNRLQPHAYPVINLHKSGGYKNTENSTISFEYVNTIPNILDKNPERVYTEKVLKIQELDSRTEQYISKSNSIDGNVLKEDKPSLDSLQVDQDPLDLQDSNAQEIITIDDDDEDQYADIATVKHDHDYCTHFKSIDTNTEQIHTTENRGGVFLNIDLAKFGNVNLQNISGVILLLNNQKIATNYISNANVTTDTNVNETIPTVQAKISKPASKKQKINKEPEIHNCEFCSMFFKSRKVLENHLKKVHYYHCEFCEASCFKTVLEIKNHIKEHHPDVDCRTCKPYFCDICIQEFSERAKFAKHFRSVHEGYFCGVCGWSFLSKDELKLHRQSHPNNYKCNVCDKSFKDKVSLTTHKKTHNDPFSFICPKCGKGCKTKTVLTAHIKSHDPPTNVMCDMCPKFFRNTAKLIIHQETVHLKLKKFQCTDCGKRFAAKALLQSHHYLMHVGEKLFQCEFCGKEFARRDYLFNHRHVHTGEPRKPRKNVNPSPKGLRRRRQYNFNFKIGKYKDQPVSCNICGKTIKNINYLRAHLNTHARIRKFQCSFCDLKFMHQTSKNNHEKTHASDPENRVVCPVCWKRMKTQEELDAHLEEHNNRPKRHTCGECGEAFSRKHLLENHLSAIHTTEEELNKREEEMIEESFKEIVQQCEFVI